MTSQAGSALVMGIQSLPVAAPFKRRGICYTLIILHAIFWPSLGDHHCEEASCSCGPSKQLGWMNYIQFATAWFWL